MILYRASNYAVTNTDSFPADCTTYVLLGEDFAVEDLMEQV
jgi:hypothetical protein